MDIDRSCFPDPDAPTETLPNGAMQSSVQYRYDLFDPYAVAQLANILHKGAVKYGENNWHGLSVETNINHALAHLFAHLMGDDREPHLAHAFTRCMFALAKYSNPNIQCETADSTTKISYGSGLDGGAFCASPPPPLKFRDL